jgi:hypothetical protein
LTLIKKTLIMSRLFNVLYIFQKIKNFFNFRKLHYEC